MDILLEAVQYSFYKDRLDQETFDTLLSFDPTPTKKYGRWIVETYLRNMDEKEHPGYFEDSKDSLPSYLKKYDYYKNKNILPKEYSDIFTFKSFFHFFKFMDDNEETFRDKEVQKTADKDAKILYRDDKTILVIPYTHAASCKWGRDSHWCTATSNTSYYNTYSKGGTLYIRRFFDNNGALRSKVGYQLYIPKNKGASMGSVECRDMADDSITDIDDFYEGLPDEIRSFLSDEIEEAGGLNAHYQIQFSGWGENLKNGVAQLRFSGILYLFSQDYSNEIDGGDDTTYSEVEVQQIGKGVELNEDSERLLTLQEFDINAGIGILVNYTTEYTPDEAESNSRNKWHQAERDDYSDWYEVEHIIKQVLPQGEAYEYIIIKGQDGLDDYMRNFLEEKYFKFYNTPHGKGRKINFEDMTDSDNESNEYTILYKVGFEYQKREGGSVSTAAQRAYDKQIDLPFKLST